MHRAVSRARHVPDAQLLGRDGDDAAHQPAREFSEEHRAPWRSLDVAAHPTAMAIEPGVVTMAGRRPAMGRNGARTGPS